MVEIITPAQYCALLANPMLSEAYSAASGCDCLVIEAAHTLPDLPPPHHVPPCPVIGIAGRHPTLDVWLDNRDRLDPLIASIREQPHACATLVQLLRHNERSSPVDGLLAESLAYSTLQQSTGFRTWLQKRTIRTPKPTSEAPVLLHRDGDELFVTLNRPQAHNAYSEAMKDALCAALHLAHTDSNVTAVILRGMGPSFCAGGDLSEFGRVTDAVLAHLSRTTRSAAALLATLPCTSFARVHGACIGAGIELPAFVNTLTAASNAFFQLPEVGMGLVPGAGGTVSITQRIGRQRTAYMAMSGARVDAVTALRWGLIDAIDDTP